MKFIKLHVKKESLASVLPIGGDSVFDLIDLLESGIEVPLTQEEEAGGKIDEGVRDEVVDVIDELNRDPSNIDFGDLNRRLSE